MAIIETKNLSFSYHKSDDEEVKGKSLILRDISLSISSGEFISLVGENGSGKSTLVKMLNVLLIPDKGSVFVNNLDTKNEENKIEIRKTCGLVFQNPDNSIISSIVEDDIAFGPENLGLEREEIIKRVSEALKETDIVGLKTKDPSMLSGGQKQRVAIAGILAMHPKVIICDEATSMLDPEGKEDILNVLKMLNKKGYTIINITHNMEETAFSKRVILMSKGRVVFDDSPENIFTNNSIIEKYNLELPLNYRLKRDLKQLLKGKKISDLIEKDNIVTPNEKNEKKASLPVIQTKELSYTYGKGLSYETKAIKNISFEIDKGGFIGIIGKTGSGKTTLIEHFNGLLKPSSGTVFFNGKDIFAKKAKLSDVRKKIGFLFQYPDYQLFAETVLEDIAFGPINLGIKKVEAEKIAVSCMERVELDPEIFKEKSPFELSGGEKRKVAIAGILAMNPDILVLDEPTANLDPKSHRKFFALISKIRKEKNLTIILVSHNMDEIAEYCEKIILLDNGNLIKYDLTKNIFADESLINKYSLRLPLATIYAKKFNYLKDKNILTYESLLENIRKEESDRI
ncbi:MAG: energy-coupling factor transporter ATPase [Clostridiales Family XIII bacterium]|jgi:energy-coupling factor transport system ATP-binding protein|nr:energy-coupling factor transporter ATPase [Clostridiales Family XIII bacterium]